MSKQILISLLNCSWQWALLGGFTWLVTRRLRRSNATFHLLWLLSLISLPILFGLNQFVPAISIKAVQPELTQSQPVEVSPIALPAVDLLDLSAIENQAPAENHTVTEGIFPAKFGLLDGLLCVWAIGVLIMLARLLFGLYRIGQLRRSATVADDAYQAVCWRLAQQMKIDRPVTVCFSDQVVSPISFGWLSPRILIPQTFSLKQFKLVAAHELAHVRRLDWLTNLFSHLVGAIFFFHPFYHFLSRRLADLREQICDDWVIQLTDARKNYAQCLLDLVRHKDQSIPLALALNQPSQLESRIGSILKNNRRLDLQPRPRLLLVAVTVLLTSLPLLAMAQLVPLRTVQLSLFSQTAKPSEEAVDEGDKKSGERTERGRMTDRKKYENHQSVKVLDPAGFNKSQENPLFSGPQAGEKLPPLKATGIRGEFDGKAFDVIAEADGKPLVLFLPDENRAGIRGLIGASRLLVDISNKSEQEIRTSVVFLGDEKAALSKWVKEFEQHVPKEVLLGISPDGHEGHGAYGLNRSVAQTILVAKEGKVIHNFAFQQPMLYVDPHVLGAVANVIGEEPATLEKWLNEEQAKCERMQRENTRSRERGPSREELIKRFDKDGDGKLNEEEGRAARKALNERGRERQNQYRGARVEVKKPAEFKKAQEEALFSGPQPGEKLPPLKVKGLRGELEGKEFDPVALAKGKPQILMFAGGEPKTGGRYIPLLGMQLQTIAKQSGMEWDLSVIYLTDKPAELTKFLAGYGIGNRAYPANVRLGIGEGGADGPGSYGINRNVTTTIIIAKDGKVTHNFAYPQDFFYNDPHILGAIADVMEVEYETMAKWVSAGGSPYARGGMQRGGEGDRSDSQIEFRNLLGKLVEEGKISREEAGELYRAAFPENAQGGDRPPAQTAPRERLGKLVEEGKISREEAGELYKAAFPENAQGGGERMERGRERGGESERENEGSGEEKYDPARVQIKDPAQFKKSQEKAVFSGPQPGEKLPPFKVTGLGREFDGKEFDPVALADGKPQILFIQDESRLGGRHQPDLGRKLQTIAKASKTEWHMSVIYVSDKQDEVSKFAALIDKSIPSFVNIGFSTDGRDGPGTYGLNRNVSLTIIVAKDGKVTHNFAFPQCPVWTDPHVLGGIAEVLGEERETLAKWLNEEQGEGERMREAKP
ncbi:hypothetical protein HYR99_04595 [Candidatus Poribacteria bacterium]|nr:hypothetical protein [Candidatus Poribacteria bacterium]